MDQDNRTIEDVEIEGTISDTPDEILRFLSSSTFTTIITAIQDVLELSPSQKERVETASYAIVTGVETLENTYTAFLLSGMPEEIAAKCIYAIKTELLDRMVALTEIATQEEGGETLEGSTDNAPSPSDILASLTERLSKAQVVAPMTRTYTETTPAPTGDTPKKTFDPYRELPEE